MSETDEGRSGRSQAANTVAPSAEAVRPGPRALRRPRLFRTFVGIGVAVLVIGAFGLALPQLHLFGDPRQVTTAAEIAALRSELQTANSRLAKMEQAAAAPQSGLLPDDTAARFQTMDSRLAALETQIARAADRDSLTALQDRLTRVEKDSAGVMLRRAATILAAANLARAAQSGAAFDQELGALRTLAPDDPALVPLEPLAVGVPTAPMLAASFPQAARDALQSDADNQAGRNPVGRVWATLRRLVNVRRIGDVEGTTNADRLARAQVNLDRGDLAAATTEAGAVTGAAAASLSPWLKNAQARLTADRAIAEINRRVAQDLVLP